MPHDRHVEPTSGNGSSGIIVQSDDKELTFTEERGIPVGAGEKAETAIGSKANRKDFMVGIVHHSLYA